MKLEAVTAAATAAATVALRTADPYEAACVQARLDNLRQLAAALASRGVTECTASSVEPWGWTLRFGYSRRSLFVAVSEAGFVARPAHSDYAEAVAFEGVCDNVADVVAWAEELSEKSFRDLFSC